MYKCYEIIRYALKIITRENNDLSHLIYYKVFCEILIEFLPYVFNVISG